MIEKQYKIEHLEQRLRESNEEVQALKNHVVSYSDKEFEAILKENRQLREKIDEVISILSSKFQVGEKFGQSLSIEKK